MKPLREFPGKCGIDATMTLNAAQSAENRRDEGHAIMRLAARSGACMPGMQGRFVDDFQKGRLESAGQNVVKSFGACHQRTIAEAVSDVNHW